MTVCSYDFTNLLWFLFLLFHTADGIILTSYVHRLLVSNVAFPKNTDWRAFQCSIKRHLAAHSPNQRIRKSYGSLISPLYAVTGKLYDRPKIRLGGYLRKMTANGRFEDRRYCIMAALWTRRFFLKETLAQVMTDQCHEERRRNTCDVHFERPLLSSSVGDAIIPKSLANTTNENRLI